MVLAYILRHGYRWRGQRNAKSEPEENKNARIGLFKFTDISCSLPESTIYSSGEFHSEVFYDETHKMPNSEMGLDSQKTQLEGSSLRHPFALLQLCRSPVLYRLCEKCIVLHSVCANVFLWTPVCLSLRVSAKQLMHEAQFTWTHHQASTMVKARLASRIVSIKSVVEYGGRRRVFIQQ